MIRSLFHSPDRASQPLGTYEVMKIHPVQKMTSAGQRNRFVCYVLVGANNGHTGLGRKCAKEIATAIRGGIIAAKMAGSLVIQETLRKTYLSGSWHICLQSFVI